MVDVVSVKFKGRGKVYYFDPAGVDVHAGDRVVVSTSKGQELCECVQGVHTVTDERIVPPLRPVVRVATLEDLQVAEQCRAKEKEAFRIWERRIAEHGLEMKLVDVECAFDGSKILFFFTADGRVDFRALVRDLAGIFRTRIELRQVGVRDEAKMLGGIGMCGRPYCCNQFLDDFQPVSTKMAKTQNLSLNPTKISGCCGRLMCCLRYEEEAYEDLVKRVPKQGTFVETVAGYGNVVSVNLLRQTVKVKLEGESETLKTCPVDEVAVIPGGRPKAGEPLPHLLQLPEKPVEEESEEEDDGWLAPPVFAEDTMDGQRSFPPAPEKQRNEGQRRHKPPKGKRPQPAEKPEKQEKPERAAKPGKPEESQKQAAAKRKQNAPGQGGKGKPPQKAGGSPEKKGQPKGPAPEKRGQQEAGAPAEWEAATAQKRKNNYRKPYRGKPKPKAAEGGKPKPQEG